MFISKRITLIDAVVMILRLWALFGRSRPILATLLVLFAIQVITYAVCRVMISTRNNPESMCNSASYYAHQITIHALFSFLAIVVQVLDFSSCVMQYDSPILPETSETSQLVLGAFMCILVAIRFVRESLQMYDSNLVDM